MSLVLNGALSGAEYTRDETPDVTPARRAHLHAAPRALRESPCLVGSIRQRLIGSIAEHFERCTLEPNTAQRFVSLETGSAVDADSRTVQLTFSSEARVSRGYGIEILSHAKDAADMSRMNTGAPLLFNHNMDDVIGVVETASIGGDRRGHASVRFAKTLRGQEVFDMVQDKILRSVSILYQINDIDDSVPGEYLVTKWQPMEISIVTVPADSSVGVGRGIR